jgi:4-diphosphocytidyl-2-C-methyl-D-erythritol kinase
MRISLEKNLPVAAGLGGGSADAAAALRGLLAIAGVDPSHPRARASAFALGADVPVCLRQLACRMRGAGESILPVNLGPFAAVLVNPGIAVETAAVFQELGLDEGASHGTPIADLTDAAGWRNDLMAPAISVASAIADVIAALQNQKGIRLARMSGSGGTCFGLFESADIARDAARLLSASHPQWWVRSAALS